MQKKQLGTSDLHITLVGVGAWAMGGGNWLNAWGDQDDNDSIAAIHRAVELGINWIDTAAIYGLGHSEEVVGRAIKGMAEPPYIFTKCQRVWNERGEISDSLKAESIRREVEASLRRLQIDTIDLYQIHWPRPDEDIEEGWGTMTELQREGKVRYIGVSNFNVEQLRRAQAIAPVTSLQPPYSLLRRDVDAEILPFCHEQQIGVIVYSPMQSGLLSGKMTRERVANLPENDWRRRNDFFKEPRLSQALDLVELLREIGERYHRSPAEVAIAWTLHNPAVTAAIVGGRNPGQVEGVVGAADLHLSDEEIAALEERAQA